ncbi:MAG: DUF763 domain-containing protein [Candidatus Omnitrophica bacterium]|nr:DUF763 domain-containing protein [Candidatus Omnitrophota bacterium]
MQKTGILELPLHTGKAPRWLFEKMVILARCIAQVIIIEFGRDCFLKRLADPLWFQAFGCVLGFDWHSSGLTTTTCAALKEAFYSLGEYKVFICGGKGRTSRKTPSQIGEIGQNLGKNLDNLVYISRLVAKVDNNALQDGFELYHHTFVFTDELKWTVIQQGMSSDSLGWARRYHWHSEKLQSFIKKPHTGISSDKFFLTLNLVDDNIQKAQNVITELSWRKKEENIKDFLLLYNNINKLPQRHRLLLSDINPKFLDKIFLKTYEKKPTNFENLLSLEGVGKKTLRALALISELIYGTNLSYFDPARYSFAHGGKDGYPYKINLARYQSTIDILKKAIQQAKIERSDRIKALRRLYRFYYLNDKEGGI